MSDSTAHIQNTNLTVIIGSVTFALAALFLSLRLISNKFLTRYIGYDDCK